MAIAYWCQAADAAGAEERARRQWEGRHLHVSPTIEGTVRIDGSVDPESGQSLIMALGAIQDAWAKDGTRDPRSAPQRRADALVELCRSYLDRSDRPQVAGERPHVVVTVDLQSLQGTYGRRSELEDTARSPRRPLGAWHVMPVSRASSPWAPPSRWMWADVPRWFPQGCAGLWCSGTEAVGSPGVADPGPGAMPTTSGTGPTVVPPPFPTSCCSAVPTTERCTKGSVWR